VDQKLREITDKWDYMNLKIFYITKSIVSKFKRLPTVWNKTFAAVFTIIKLWKQPRCPSTEERIKKMWYLYTMEFYSATKTN
jgi:hypothetical protein